VKKSFYASLKPADRAELDRRLIDSGFADYDDHLMWLKSLDCIVSKTVLSKYGDRYRDKLEAIKLQHDYRRAYGEELSDEIEVNANALIAISQQLMLGLLERLQKKASLLSEDADLGSIAVLLSIAGKAVTAVGTLNSSQAVQKKMLEALREKQEAKLDAMGGDEKSGITQAFLDDIRTNILRI
jgi:Protein of unknown function (DUF3486)